MIKSDAINARQEKVFSKINVNGFGLEIGASFNPLAPKSSGFNCEVLDHASADELKEKYKRHGVNVNLIEEVDYIWNGEELSELIGKKNCYDYIIASHVIEHTPDLISFIKQCEILLKQDGILSLVIPDKRYCFDYFRPLSTTGDVLQAHVEKRTRHTLGTIFDHFSLAAQKGDSLSWDKNDTYEFKLRHQFDEAVKIFEESKTNSNYIDVHNWKFIPESFNLVISDISHMKLTNFIIVNEFDTCGYEFYVSLAKKTDISINNSVSRLDKLCNIKSI